MKKPNLPIIILCLAICVSGIAALSLKTFHTVNSTTSPYLLYLKVLQGNQQFYNVESGDYLDIHQLKETITSDNLPFSIQQFAIVDLTQNGIKDVVLQFSLAENNQAGFIILHDESGTIYSYTLVSRSMSDLKVDGTFIFSSGASDWGIGSLILSSSGYEIEKISYCESSLFFVDKLPATQAAFETAVSQQGFKENVTWYNFTDDNLSLLTIPCRGIGIQHIRKIIDNLNLLIVPKRRNRPSLVNRAGFIPNICIFTSRNRPRGCDIQ